MPSGPYRAAGWALVLLAPATILAILHLNRVELVDDAYITFRYVENLLGGHGLVFNPGERVEGLSNALWAFLLVPARYLGLDIEMTARGLGLLLAGAALADALRASYRLAGGSCFAAAAAGICVAGFANYWLSAASGLETGLAAFLVTRGFIDLLDGRTLRLAFVGILAALTRPEMVGIFGLAYLCALPLRIDAMRSRQGFARTVALHAAVWAIGIAAITLGRFWYFGELVPNSLLAKSVSLDVLGFRGIYHNALKGIGYVLQFLIQFPAALLAILVAPFFRACAVAALLFAAESFVCVVNGGDWMPHTRLLTPFAPALAIGLGSVVEPLARFLAGQWPQMGALAARAWILALAFAGGAASIAAELFRPDLAYRDIECHRWIAEALRPHLQADDKVTSEQLGMMGWRLHDTYFHDMFGLTDRYVARHGREYAATFGKSNFEYTIAEVRPTLIVVHSGFLHLKRMNAASGDAVETNYSLYKISDYGHCRATQMIAVRADREGALAAALRAIGGVRVALP